MNRQTIASLALCLALGQTVLAGELDSFVAPVEGARANWSRSYDAAHLAAHPDQLVTAMAFEVYYEKFDPALDGQVSFELKVSMRGSVKAATTGSCMPDGADTMFCGVECDGGGLVISHRANGSILADLSRVGYIRMSEVGCGEQDPGVTFDLEAGKDDKLFLLHKS